MDPSKLVRVNCKFDPTHTGIKFPPAMQNCVKSTLARNARSGKWEIAEDRVSIEMEVQFAKGKFDRCAIFTLDMYGMGACGRLGAYCLAHMVHQLSET